ncbi:LLM class flavin-dependent oxidoreductase [Streptomyces zagrosensis]|uniref:Alkanesulfonate monooxygenase SsuD/methylene tetrahydromethanopterin reductase-like flavin-dependent oxidoreductase (Luciferase family) n=1 Tax=Streptomyces zagrosensis TaxID=1042984 RepID=A0A7W9QE99_9ACTN|nr:LLM class flavin-dependent oxidoreductase [Streptomyces zagrosensis]MBB5937432.1 alkanesulfonate monooxygenase SsuD/methylene tetrahydromethanopterin reductase-like flavin-dependent oxidoreductase (luciferase family) [Streptomyces zagrosensis]
MPPLNRPLRLAVALDGGARYSASAFAERAQLAERGAFDFITLEDSLGQPAPGVGRLDALAVLASVAPATERIGLLPTVTTTHTEPFHLSASIATLDWVSRGRGGWIADVSTSEADARLIGRRPAAPIDELWHEAGEVVDVVTRLFDSWEDDAEIRDIATGRFIDRDKLHYVDFETATFSVRGPSIVPRPPQGHPVTAIDATAPHARQTAARYADVAFVRTQDPDTARAVRADLRERARAWGREPDRLIVLASLSVDLDASADAVALAELVAAWHTDGAADGFHFRPRDAERDLRLLVNGTVPVLQHRGLVRHFYPGATLREHLGLPRPTNRYALAREASAR